MRECRWWNETRERMWRKRHALGAAPLQQSPPLALWPVHKRCVCSKSRECEQTMKRCMHMADTAPKRQELSKMLGGACGT